MPDRPLSLAPYNALSTLLALVPAIAMFCAIVRLKAYRRRWLVLALLAGAFGGIMLGTLQISSPDPRTSPWYLYRQSSFGFAAGFFANVNNMGMLLVICLPFLAALAVSARGGEQAALLGSARLKRRSGIGPDCRDRAQSVVGWLWSCGARPVCKRADNRADQRRASAQVGSHCGRTDRRSRWTAPVQPDRRARPGLVGVGRIPDGEHVDNRSGRAGFSAVRVGPRHFPRGLPAVRGPGPGRTPFE